MSSETTINTKPTLNREAKDENEKIIHQLEFYFGDGNLYKDKFLRNKIQESDEGWVSLDVLMSFNMLKQFGSEKVLIALETPGELIELNEEKTAIRRTVPYVYQDLTDRSVFISKIPLNKTVPDLVEYFSADNEVIYIEFKYNRTDNGKKFKGMAIIYFSTPEKARAFRKSGPHEMDGARLEVKMNIPGSSINICGRAYNKKDYTRPFYEPKPGYSLKIVDVPKKANKDHIRAKLYREIPNLIHFDFVNGYMPCMYMKDPVSFDMIDELQNLQLQAAPKRPLVFMLLQGDEETLFLSHIKSFCHIFNPTLDDPIQKELDKRFNNNGNVNAVSDDATKETSESKPDEPTTTEKPLEQVTPSEDVQNANGNHAEAPSESKTDEPTPNGDALKRTSDSVAEIDQENSLPASEPSDKRVKTE